MKIQSAYSPLPNASSFQQYSIVAVCASHHQLPSPVNCSGINIGHSVIFLALILHTAKNIY